MATIQAVIAEPGKGARVLAIEDSLEGMQQAVEGNIELAVVKDDRRVGRLDFYCNEEGRLDGMPMNRIVDGIDICGSILVVSSDHEGETVGLTDEQAALAVLLLDSCPRAVLLDF